MTNLFKVTLDIDGKVLAVERVARNREAREREVRREVMEQVPGRRC